MTRTSMRVLFRPTCSPMPRRKAPCQTSPSEPQVVARLCPQEVHVLARAGIDSLADLAGKKVNFGPDGGSSAVTATILFRALNIEVEPVALDGRAAIEQLKQGAIAASVFVGAKPMPADRRDSRQIDGLHLLPSHSARASKPSICRRASTATIIRTSSRWRPRSRRSRPAWRCSRRRRRTIQATPTVWRNWSTRSSRTSAN